jgi:Fur family transcriptional regulator, stress-responsive regulator
MSSDDEAELKELLRARGMRVTSQRLLIHRALRVHAGHASSEQVYELVGSALPGVSQQTVYSTLTLLAELGLARRVPVPGGTARFEARVDDHHHMVCERCGALEDLDARVPMAKALDASRAAGFAPTSAAVTVLGLCAACAGESADS